jgi:hypothetical protein
MIHSSVPRACTRSCRTTAWSMTTFTAASAPRTTSSRTRPGNGRRAERLPLIGPPCFRGLGAPSCPDAVSSRPTSLTRRADATRRSGRRPVDASEGRPRSTGPALSDRMRSAATRPRDLLFDQQRDSPLGGDRTLSDMTANLSIGGFSRATYLSIKDVAALPRGGADRAGLRRSVQRLSLLPTRSDQDGADHPRIARSADAGPPRPRREQQ